MVSNGVVPATGDDALSKRTCAPAGSLEMETRDGGTTWDRRDQEDRFEVMNPTRERGMIHVLAPDLYLKGDDPIALFAEMAKRGDIDVSHAFYLGYEMAKAMTALTLGKNYTQDQALRWGFATREEKPGRHSSGE